MLTGGIHLPDFAPKRRFYFFVNYTLLLVASIISDGVYLFNFVPKRRLCFFAGYTILLVASVILIKGHLTYIGTISRY